MEQIEDTTEKSEVTGAEQAAADLTADKEQAAGTVETALGSSSEHTDEQITPPTPPGGGVVQTS